MDRDAVFGRAERCHRGGRLAEAEAAYRELLAEDSGDPEVLRHFARCVGEQGRTAEALPWARRAVALEPAHAGGRVVLAGLLGFEGEFEAAGEQLRRALELSPHLPAARWNHALWLLLHGRYEEGWHEYRWGIVNRERRVRHVQPEWDGYRRCDGLFVWAEQGFGDTLQFLRFLPQARERSGARRVILEVQEPLVSLLAGHPFADEVIAQQLDGAMPGAWEEHVSLMSLPGVLGTTLETIPGEPYLWVEPELGVAGGCRVEGELVPDQRPRGALLPSEPPSGAEGGLPSGRAGAGQEAADRGGERSPQVRCFGGVPMSRPTSPSWPPHPPILGGLSREIREGGAGGRETGFPSLGVRVGVCWAGNPAHPNDRNRSVTPELIEPLFEVNGVQWVCLQQGGEVEGALNPPLRDFAETARVVAGLDLVITVDTAVAHLAGALGKPVWVLLPLVGDFRWLRDREDSPWYPSARLFRQARSGEWAPVIERVKEALRAIAG